VCCANCGLVNVIIRAVDHHLSDFDSNDWPSQARHPAVGLFQDSVALHIYGDTHLTTLTQYGVSQQRDSAWSFCTPAIAVGWQRWWLPDSVSMPHRNGRSHGLTNAGLYRDTFGNLVYMHAVGNPEKSSASNPCLCAHQKGSDFGYLVFDQQRETVDIHACRLLIDVDSNEENQQFQGWPVKLDARSSKRV